MAASTVDMELRKAFQELQVKMVDTQQQLKLLDMQVEQQKRLQQHAKLTESEIIALPDGIKVYEGVGRMFLLHDKPTIKTVLEDKVKSCDDKIKNLEGSKVYYQKKLKESEDNLREMVAQRQAAKP
ncbi:prefoldin subunit 1-like [Apostichopus japonicus]|uniref:prefoldin subunit 1-like n=1 Tax=Stichopus japonicus TaxID=307972 RepID=UPI003AB51B0B